MTPLESVLGHRVLLLAERSERPRRCYSILGPGDSLGRLNSLPGQNSMNRLQQSALASNAQVGILTQSWAQDIIQALESEGQRWPQSPAKVTRRLNSPVAKAMNAGPNSSTLACPQQDTLLKSSGREPLRILDEPSSRGPGDPEGGAVALPASTSRLEERLVRLMLRDPERASALKVERRIWLTSQWTRACWAWPHTRSRRRRQPTVIASEADKKAGKSSKKPGPHTVRRNLATKTPHEVKGSANKASLQRSATTLRSAIKHGKWKPFPNKDLIVESARAPWTILILRLRSTLFCGRTFAPREEVNSTSPSQPVVRAMALRSEPTSRHLQKLRFS